LVWREGFTAKRQRSPRNSTNRLIICSSLSVVLFIANPFAAASSRWETEGRFPRPTAYSAHTRQIWTPAKACPLCPVCRVCGGSQRRWEGTGCISFRRRPETNQRWLPTRQDVSSQRRRGRCPEDGSPIRKIRASRGLGAIPTSLPLEGSPARSLARGLLSWGPKQKKPPDSSHWLSFSTMPEEDRNRKQAQLGLGFAASAASKRSRRILGRARPMRNSTVGPTPSW